MFQLPQLLHRVGLYFCFLPVIVMTLSCPVQGQEPLTLRVNDGESEPGGLMAVVLRTYSPRGLTQGQICLGSSGGNPLNRGGQGPLQALEEVRVFSGEGPVSFQVDEDPANGSWILSFESQAGGVNRDDGPLAVLFFRVAADSVPEQEFEIIIDAQGTSLLDVHSNPVPLEPRAGRFKIVEPGEPLELSVEDTPAHPGGQVTVALATERSVDLAGGEIWLDIPPELLPMTSAEIVGMVDSRHGQAQALVERPSLDQLRVILSSPDGSFNHVPGEILTLSWPLPDGLMLTSQWPVGLDGATFLSSADGPEVELQLEPGIVTVEPEPPLFDDGFESGNLDGWSRHVGG